VARELNVTYDPVAKRYVACCEVEDCGRQFLRSSRESAVWNLRQHLVYQHGVDPDERSAA
jgi:hypothetical protein